MTSLHWHLNLFFIICGHIIKKVTLTKSFFYYLFYFNITCLFNIYFSICIKYAKNEGQSWRLLVILLIIQLPSLLSLAINTVVTILNTQNINFFHCVFFFSPIYYKLFCDINMECGDKDKRIAVFELHKVCSQI